MSDPFIHRRVKAMVQRFNSGPIEAVVDATDEAIRYINEGWVFGPKSTLWIERGEDLYASHHFSGKPYVRLYREDFLRARRNN